MPIVQVDPLGTERVSLTRQPRARADAPLSAFGGGPIVNALGTLAKVGLGISERADEASAEEAAVQFEREKNQLFFNPENGYFNTSGRNAFDGAQPAQEALEKLQKTRGEGLSVNARKMFDRIATRHVTAGAADIGRHASKGLEAWEVGGIEASVENSIESAALYWSDEREMRIQNVAGRSSILELSKRQGWGSEETAEKLQTFDSSFISAAISGAVNSSADEAAGLLDKFGDKLEGPMRVKVEKQIEAKRVSEKTADDARRSVTKATGLTAKYTDDTTGDIDRNAAIEEVNKIPDPELRKKTLSEVDHQFNAKKTAYSERRAQIFEDAEDAVIRGGSAEQFKSQRPGDWELLSPKQKQAVQSGEVVQTDWNTFSDLMIKPKTELAAVNPEEHFHKLAPPERRTLVSAVKTARGVGSDRNKVDSQVGRSRTAETTATVDQMFGRPSKRNPAELRQANAFHALVDSEVSQRESELVRKLSSEEYTNILGGLSRKVVQEDALFGFIDTTSDLTDIPADDMPELSAFLRAKNIPVTSDNLIKLYNQVR